VKVLWNIEGLIWKYEKWFNYKINRGGLFVKIEKYFEKQTKILKLLPHEFSFEYFLNKKRILLKIYMMAKNTIKKKRGKRLSHGNRKNQFPIQINPQQKVLQWMSFSGYIKVQFKNSHMCVHILIGVVAVNELGEAILMKTYRERWSGWGSRWKA
jgi:hypothetical protein